ncbi:MAG: hypothetical protein PF541_02295 [Prolixibacteraceae bacterium]|jgi:hypothetical protein|nr:hypothetical protein [Prolixibacteraceae bacterium]
MEKLTNKIGVITLLLSLTIGTSMAQNISLGAALKGSTMGVGGDVVVQFHDRMTARIGYDMMGYGPLNFTFEESDIKYDASADFKTGSLTALYDFYLSKILFVSVGAGLNNFQVNVAGRAGSDLPWGDIEIPADKVGNFDITVEPGIKVSPYLGIGLGRTLSKDKSLGFAFEVGSYYMGSPNLTIESTGLIAPTSNPNFGQEELLENQLSQYYLYPVLKFSLSYKFLSL